MTMHPTHLTPEACCAGGSRPEIRLRSPLGGCKKQAWGWSWTRSPRACWAPPLQPIWTLGSATACSPGVRCAA